MSGLFIFLVIFLAVVCMVLAISKFNQHPFIVLTVIAIAVGLVCGIPTEEVINTVKSGFGNILASIGIVILAGTIIGTILEKTGAALTMANTILKMVGKKEQRPDHGHHRLCDRYPCILRLRLCHLKPYIKGPGQPE